MNKLSCLVGNNSQILFEESIKQIGCFLNDFSKENIVIVPDRLSLITEQKIFELLNISVYFNISVMGISKFANKIIKDNGLNFLQCTALQSKLLTLKAIQNVKDQFKCFSKNYTFGLIDEIYAKIEQIKSSDAKIEDLIDEKASIGTKLKYHDIALIYNEYEKLRGERLDSGALLSVFNSISSESEYLKKCNVFFIGFDSITRQGLGVIKNTIKNAHHCFVSVLSPNENQPNQNIYDRTFLTSIKKLRDEEGIDVNITTLNIELQNNTKHIIQNNIFSRKTNANTNNFVNIYKSSSITDELDFLIKSITYNIKTQNLLFKDIAICAPDDYAEKIKSNLNANNIDCHTDLKTSFYNLEPIKYILNYLNFLNEPQDKNNLIQLITNSFCPLSEECKPTLINLINKFSSLNTIKKYGELNDEILIFINELLSLTKPAKNTCENYLNDIKNFIINNEIYSKINNCCEIFKQKGEVFLEKTYLQIENKLTNIILEINEILQNLQLEFNEFIDLFKKAIENIEISAIPSTINQVFIGNTKSFYNSYKYIYIISANETIFPEILIDSGLISDKEISSESIKAQLEPTTKVINKRNKIKALDIILSASQKCYISYHCMDIEGKNVQPSEFIGELKYLFNIEEINTNIFSQYTHQNASQIICFNNTNTYNANLNMRCLNDEFVSMIIKNSLIKCNKLYLRAKQANLQVDFKNLFFKNNKASISLIEKYNSCPKASFLSDGLKLRKNEKEKVEANIIGSFIHEVAELFIKTNNEQLGNLSLKLITDFVNKTTKEIVIKEQYYSLNLEENKFIYELIVKECVRFCEFINYEQTISQFKPIYTEKYFGENSNFKPLELTVNGTTYKISGIVDRIDYCDDYFRIIDYKSGSPNFKNIKDGLFYGTKLQLFVYAKAIDKNVDKKLFGAFYMPVRNTFIKQNESNYSYVGFFIDSFSLAQKCDSNFNILTKESKLLNCKINKPKKDGTINFRKNDNIISLEELKAYEKYAIKIMSYTLKNMQDGFIECLPIKDKCKHCEYQHICKNKDNKNLIRNKIYEFKNAKFLEFNYE